MGDGAQVQIFRLPHAGNPNFNSVSTFSNQIIIVVGVLVTTFILPLTIYVILYLLYRSWRRKMTLWEILGLLLFSYFLTFYFLIGTFSW